MPKNISSIDYGAFINCESLESLSVPMGCKSVERYAFLGCNGLKRLELPDTLMNIDCLFRDYREIPDSMYVVGDNTKGSYAQNYVDGIRYDLTAYGDKKHRYYHSTSDGVVFTIDDKILLKYPSDKKDNVYVVPSDTYRLSDNAFSNNSHIKVIDASNVQSIGLGSFSNCPLLESVMLSDDAVCDAAAMPFENSPNVYLTIIGNNIDCDFARYASENNIPFRFIGEKSICKNRITGDSKTHNNAEFDDSLLNDNIFDDISL